MARCPEDVVDFKRCVLPICHDGNCTLGPVVEVDYRNWKGVRRVRRAVFTGQMRRMSNPPWHAEEQWLLAVIDCEDGKHKWFALDGFYGFKEQPT